jgi:hypothetical protein
VAVPDARGVGVTTTKRGVQVRDGVSESVPVAEAAGVMVIVCALGVAVDTGMTTFTRTVAGSLTTLFELYPNTAILCAPRRIGFHEYW